MLKDEQSLWLQVLQKKYFRHSGSNITRMKTSDHSPLWKPILKAMIIMKSETCWSVRNGRSTSFWCHPWINEETILEDFLFTNISAEEREEPVCNWVHPSGTWDWERLTGLLPDDILFLLAGIDTPRQNLGEDTTIWGIDQDGRFRLKSAYKVVANKLDLTRSKEWKQLWKWKGPNIIRHFLWLALHDRLLTNQERVRRKFTDDGSCKHCNGIEETTEHILRHCRKTKELWRRLRHSITMQDQNINFGHWLITNIRDDERGTHFGIILWHLWKQRNEETMEGKAFNEQSPIQRILAYFNIVKNAQNFGSKIDEGPQRRKTALNLEWTPPNEGWMKINTDRLVINGNKAATRSLIRRFWPP
ncbi:unnamed protein product [Linum trigynum]|uniref:Reverse transcriptase zinc-binding domain-containing protein n=1 Tax=Linum trigynum TaxID=586398 RepID=A0AAV2ERB4_9ROSI